MTSASESGLYGARWQRMRKAHFRKHPLCVMCQEDGYLRGATELDHIVKHNGNRQLFYAADNLQGLCADHHRGYKARIERSGKDRGCDIHGNPTESRAHWG